jgi:hypothetical protein
MREMEDLWRNILSTEIPGRNMVLFGGVSGAPRSFREIMEGTAEVKITG